MPLWEECRCLAILNLSMAIIRGLVGIWLSARPPSSCLCSMAQRENSKTLSTTAHIAPRNTTPLKFLLLVKFYRLLLSQTLNPAFLKPPSKCSRDLSFGLFHDSSAPDNLVILGIQSGGLFWKCQDLEFGTLQVSRKFSNIIVPMRIQAWRCMWIIKQGGIWAF